MTTNPSEQQLRQQLNLETGKITWPELQRHFARGVVIKVEPSVDLVDVAAKFAVDDKSAIAIFLENGTISRCSDEDAKSWTGTNVVFWAVVVAPWVLIQELNE